MNSPKSVVEKLNLNKYPRKLILNKPEDLDDFNELDYDSAMNNGKYDKLYDTRVDGKIDFTVIIGVV
jgi:hypothetical protein